MTDKRMDMYSELAEALGCDAMDSHGGRLDQARAAKNARDDLREARTLIARVLGDQPGYMKSDLQKDLRDFMAK